MSFYSTIPSSIIIFQNFNGNLGRIMYTLLFLISLCFLYFVETFIASEVSDGNPRQRYCCLISQPSSKHHEVRIKDSGFYPLSVKAKKGDIVWWKWSGTKTLLGLEQVSKQISVNINMSRLCFSLNLTYVNLCSSE